MCTCTRACKHRQYQSPRKIRCMLESVLAFLSLSCSLALSLAGVRARSPSLTHAHSLRGSIARSLQHVRVLSLSRVHTSSTTHTPRILRSKRGSGRAKNRKFVWASRKCEDVLNSSNPRNPMPKWLESSSVSALEMLLSSSRLEQIKLSRFSPIVPFYSI